jgi:hypothetical protein
MKQEPKLISFLRTSAFQLDPTLTGEEGIMRQHRQAVTADSHSRKCVSPNHNRTTLLTCFRRVFR